MSETSEQTPVPGGDVLLLLIHFFKVYPSRSLAVIGLLSFAGLAEGISVVALLPFVEIALSGTGAQTSGAGRWIAGTLSLVGLASSIGSLLVLMSVGIAIKAAVTLIAMKEVGYAVGRMMTDLRQKLIGVLMSARWSYFVARPLGVFANAIGAETIRAGVTYHQSARLAAAAIQALVYGVATIIVSWQVALIAVIAGVFGAFLFRKVVAATHEAGARQTDLMRSLAVRTTDTLQGIKPIKAMGEEKSALPLLDREIRELDAEQRKQVWSGELLRVAQEPVLVILLSIGVYFGVVIGGQSLPTLMVVVVLFYRLFNRFQAMQEIYQQIGTGASAYWAIYRLSEEAGREGERRQGAAMLPAGVPRIELHGVSFSYGAADVLGDISLSIEPGEFLTISGASGGGKTTLIDLLSGLLTPKSGAVLIEGRDLQTIDMFSWRSRLGYVPQEMLLLHDTIYRNVCLGNESISRARVKEALCAADIWDVVAALPDGMDTMVGERGSRFSGGQRQRISLARALARQPAVLLLDEITAALDEKTEREICATLRRLSGSITIIAVSHQAEMMRVADRALRLEDRRLTVAKDTRQLTMATDHV